MDTCLGCNKAIIHTEGKRKRKWCSDACRVATWRRSEPITEQVNTEQSNTVQSIPNKPKRGKDIKCFADLPRRGTKQSRWMAWQCSGTVILSPVCVGKPGDADYNGVCTEVWRAERGR